MDYANAYERGHIDGASGLGQQDVRTYKRVADERRPQEVGAGGSRADQRTGPRSRNDADGTFNSADELLGFPHVRNYDGSWTEYGSVIGVPIDDPAKVSSEDLQPVR